MIKIPRLYTPENVERARYAQIGTAIVAVALCAYMGFSTMRGVQDVCRAERRLGEMRLQSGRLSREAANLEKEEASRPVIGRGGVEMFAVRLSNWARDNGVIVETLAPEGNPTTTEVKADDIKLGTWNQHRVRVQGRGDFLKLMSMLDELRNPHMPVRLESLSVQGTDSGERGIVSFNILCSVYEKKSKPS